MAGVERVHRLQGAHAYQERPELEALLSWWREVHAGVCALIGLGGSGKTALAARFVERAPFAEDDAVFVYSFYEEPIAEVFFAKLWGWLRGEAATPVSASSHLAVIAELRASRRRRLLVLDGLERAQDDGARGGVFGELEDTALRDLLMYAASGLLGDTAVLTTTRFAIAPLERERAPLFRRVDVDALSSAAALALMRARGVRGSDEALLPIVEACARHALLLDLTAGYLAEAGGGDPRTPLLREGEAELEAALLETVPADRRARVELEHRFARIARRYREWLEAQHPEARALLRLACLFRDGVLEETLLKVRARERGSVRLAITAPASLEPTEIADVVAMSEGRRPLFEMVSRLGSSASDELVREIFVASYSDRGELVFAGAQDDAPVQLELSLELTGVDVVVRLLEIVRQVHAELSRRPDRAAFEFLARLGLVDAREGRVSVHPAIRESFASGEPAAEKSAHQRAAAVLRERANLGDRPEVLGVPLEAEELIYHLVEAGEAAEAWSLYQVRLGGFSRLGVQRAAYGRGDAICRIFARGRSPLQAPEPDLPPVESAAFLNEWGLYLYRLGRLDEAIACFEKAARLASAAARADGAAIALQNLADAQHLRGHLPRARKTLLAATELLLASGDPPEKVRPVERFVRESRRELLPIFVDAGAESAGESEPQDQTIEALQSRGAWLDAERLCRWASIGARAYFGGTHSAYHAYLSLYLAEIARELGETTRALGHLRFAGAWALEHGERELLARVLLEGGRSAADEDRIEEAMRIARDSGYALVSIDVLLARAELAIAGGDEDFAFDDVSAALRAASDPETGYARGALRAYELLARIHEREQEPARAVAELDRALAIAKRTKSSRFAVLEQYRNALVAGRREEPPRPVPRDRSLVIVYAAADSAWLEELLRVLSPQTARERCTLVNEALAPADVQRALERAKMVVLLLSPAFLEPKPAIALELLAGVKQLIAVPVGERARIDALPGAAPAWSVWESGWAALARRLEDS